MGTNYYTEECQCDHCGRGGKRLHIGKSSAGWVFALHVVPESGLNDLGDWERFWEGKTIVDEYGQDIEASEMINIITNRSGGKKESAPYGYKDWSSFHLENSSEPGPRNLLRHQINEGCIGHGRGTWDLIIGEFS
jgi:hypothetical protein